ncbi:phaC PHA synthase, partial [Aeromonas salmonicida subsp. salmonicida]
MTMEHMDAIGIGWDVRGWQGNAQAVAVVGWQAREQRLHWFGVSPLFRLSSRVAPDLDALLRPALQDEMSLMQVLACPQLALGIDAPLAFPRALGDLLAGRATECAVPQREIDNPYAYRDC